MPGRASNQNTAATNHAQTFLLSKGREGGRKTHRSVMAREYIKKVRRRGVFSVLLRSDKFYQV